MSTKIFVGNLPYTVSDKDLSELFSPYGEISEAVVIKEKHSGRSKGFGFVTFINKESADKAVSEMNDKEFQGRSIKVSEARPMDAERPMRRSFSSRRF